MRHTAYPRPGIFRSVWCAIRGIFFTIISQQNMVIHLVLTGITIFLGIYFKIPRNEWMYLSFAILFVLFAETINTAVEISIDLVTRKHKFRAMLAKDVAAGAVLISAIHAGVVGYTIFFDHIFNLIKASIFLKLL
jgi:diacylglycerol kinase